MSTLWPNAWIFKGRSIFVRRWGLVSNTRETAIYVYICNVRNNDNTNSTGLQGMVDISADFDKQLSELFSDLVDGCQDRLTASFSGLDLDIADPSALAAFHQHRALVAVRHPCRSLAGPWRVPGSPNVLFPMNLEGLWRYLKVPWITKRCVFQTGS